MAHFLVSAKKKPRLDSEGVEITVGTRTSCDLTLRDPIAAEVHCRIAAEASGFTIEDAGTATGTYVNGLAIEGPTVLREGDEIVVGVNKLCVHLEAEEGGAGLHLDLQEDKFFQKAKSVGGEWIPGDREAFKEAEINFSEFPVLRAVGWGAILVACALVGSLALPTVRGGLAQPGPLHNVHAEHIEASDCAACHEAFGEVSSGLCMDCHEVSLAGRHPFQLSSSGDLAAHSSEGLCTTCHVEHMGTESTLREVDTALDLWPGVRPQVLVRDPAFVPEDVRAVVDCTECHEEKTIDDARDRLASSGDRTGDRERRPSLVEGFDHSLHAGEREIACAVCHVPEAGGPGRGRDFAAVTFTSCMSCHHADGNTAYELAAVRLDEDWIGVAPSFELEYHGRQESGCARCHETPSEGPLRSVSTEVLAFRDADGADVPSGDGLPRLLFAVTSRGHATEASRMGGACLECHQHGELGSTERGLRRFWHALHLPNLAGADATDAEARTLSATCAECHAGVVSSDTLSGDVFSGESCASCHASDANGVAAPRVETPAAKTVRRRVDFPHDLHVGSDSPLLARECLSCHTFTAGTAGGDGLRAVVETPPEVASCVACHTDHENVGGGTCTTCHETGDLFRAVEASAPRWGSSFRHFQVGHVENVRDCTGCHAGVRTAERLADVVLPDTTGPGCFECHFERRFHWR